MVSREMMPGWVFLSLFICTLLFGTLFQWWLLPETPWYAGHGLMKGGDWLQFFEEARNLAERIRSAGWGEWELRYDGQWPASLMAAVFVLTGREHASVVLPVYSALYALTGAALTAVALKLDMSDRRALMVLLVLAFPSTIVIWGQPHKDVFSLTGIVLLIWSWSTVQFDSGVSRWLRVALGVFLGFGLIWLPRPYLIEVSLIAMIIGMVVSIACARERQVLALRGSLFVLMALLAVLSYKAAGQAGQAGQRMCLSWKPELYIPFVNEQVGSLICYRHSFIRSYSGQASNIDFDRPLTNYHEIFSYLPRAALLALTSPVPSFGALTGSIHATSPGGKMKLAIAAYEMIVFYGGLIGCVIWIWKGEGSQRAFASGVFVFALAVAVFYVLSSPNEGTLFRMRFPEFTLWWLLGVAGWNLLRLEMMA